MKTPTETLVRRGRFIRERRGIDITQRELGDVLGLHRPAISAIEAGERDLTLREGLILSEKLGCDVEQLNRGRW